MFSKCTLVSNKLGRQVAPHAFNVQTVLGEGGMGPAHSSVVGHFRGALRPLLPRIIRELAPPLNSNFAAALLVTLLWRTCEKEQSFACKDEFCLKC